MVPWRHLCIDMETLEDICRLNIGLTRYLRLLNIVEERSCLSTRGPGGTQGVEGPVGRGGGG